MQALEATNVEFRYFILTSRRSHFEIVDYRGRFSEEAGGSLAGKSIFTDGMSTVVDQLKQAKSLIHEEMYIHKYPYDWRTKKPIIIRYPLAVVHQLMCAGQQNNGSPI